MDMNRRQFFKAAAAGLGGSSLAFHTGERSHSCFRSEHIQWGPKGHIEDLEQ